MNSYDLLIQRLDQFIRKYYLNQLIRGALISAGIILVLFLGFNLLEHYFYFDKPVRKIFFYSFILLSLFSLAYWVMAPLMKYFRLGNTLDHDTAASIIGSHFSDVKDRLINILHLKRQDSSSNALIDASINQKIDNIKLVPFRSAVDLRSNKKYLRYALPPFLLLLFMLFAAPSLITNSTHRIINNNTEFEREAPFHFVVENDPLEVLEGEDLALNIKLTGTAFPEDAFIQLEDFVYKLNQEDIDRYSYVFKNLQKDQTFNFFSGQFASKSYNIKVLPKAAIEDFSLQLSYPKYTGRKSEILNNVGDVYVPQGSTLKWVYNTKNTETLNLKLNNKIHTFKESRKNVFSFSKKIFSSASYTVLYANNNMNQPDSNLYTISVLPDNYPTITAEQFIDSVETKVNYFVGSASDDYGLQSLSFNYTILDESGRTKKKSSEPILTKPTKETSFDYILDLATYELEAGDKMTYYFETFDNDQVNGSKSSKTEVFTFDKPTIEEFEEQEQLNEEEIKEDLKKALEESKKLQKELQKLREKLLQKKEPDWQDQKELEKLLEKQKEIEEKIKEAKEKFDKNLENQDEFTERKEEILEKQEKLQELFEEAMNPEMEELMQQIQEMMQELNKEEMMEKMEDFKMNEEQMEQDMDRLLELFKQLEVEKEMKDMIEKLDELSKKQDELSEETKEEKKSPEALEEEQEKLNEEFDDLKKDMEKMEEKNEELEFPKPMEEDNEEKMEDIQEEMEKSQESLEKKDSEKASDSQKKAAQKMQQMAGSLQEQMESGEMEQMEEDMQALRQLLENLITLSFDQEDLVDDFDRSSINTPRYVELVQHQFKLKEDFELISDSLYALSKRVSEIESFVTDKVVEVERNMDESLEKLEDRKKPNAQAHQRKAMTNVNDLALMLSEAMNQMQQNMAAMMAGNQMCNKPGSGSNPKPNGKSGGVPMDKITQGQEQMGEKLKEMQGKGKSGGNSAKDFAQAAAKQAALRKALEELRQEKQEQGQSGQGLQEIIDQMNKIEQDLVNKKLDSQLLKRQEDIKTRLLEAEKADRQREFDNKRKAEAGKEKVKTLPPNIQAYIKKKEAEIDLYKKVSPELRPYYKQLVDKYYDALKKP